MGFQKRPEVDRLFLFLSKIEDAAKEFGYEIKTDAYDVYLWPTYDEKTGRLGEWLALYIRERKEENGIPETTGTTEAKEKLNGVSKEAGSTDKARRLTRGYYPEE